METLICSMKLVLNSIMITYQIQSKIFLLLFFIYNHCQDFILQYTNSCFQDVAETCGVSAMPTFQVYKGGSKIDELIGAPKKEQLEQLFQR